MENSSKLRTENDSGKLQMKNYSNTTVLCFKWKTLVVGGELQVENYRGWLQMKNGGGLSRRTTVVGGELQVENNSG